jgi:threonine dehydrogenase-like Zn-dependent dehydrogenase
MKALSIDRKVTRFAAAKVAAMLRPGLGGVYGPLECVHVDPPTLPVDDGSWHVLAPRLSGICGSDLATIDAHSSRYFEPIVSFPFTPGHEIVADALDGSLAGQRVVVVPVLSCVTRGIDPPCAGCAAGQINRCERVAFGHLSPGLQTGFCADTGGGWSTQMVAHTTQLVAVPDDLDDADAVMVEPTACAVHAARHFTGQPTVIIGAGTVGLLTLAAVAARRTPGDGPVIVTARYPHQVAAARALGADRVVVSTELARTVRSLTSAMVTGDQLTAGMPMVIDCVGSSDSLTQALQVVAPGGEIILVGMPAQTSVDLTALWHREVAIRGCYAYERADFDIAIDVVRRFGLGRFVTQSYPLDDYAAAIEHAANAGRRGAIKIAFQIRGD